MRTILLLTLSNIFMTFAWYGHLKYRKAPRSYLIPRSGWRFWVAYAGFVWLPLLIAIPFFARWMAGRH